MQFGSPAWLPALALCPLLYLWLRRDAAVRRRLEARLGDRSLLGLGSDPRSETARRRQGRSAPVALGLIVLALARPQWGQEAGRGQVEAAQVMVVLDVSASMLAADMSPSRLERAKLEIRDLLQRLEGDQFGLVLFSGAAFVQCPLTVDRVMVQDFLDLAQPAVISRPGTALASAIQAAMAGFDPQRESQRVILIFTDGEDPDSDPEAAAREAREAGITIYTVGFGQAEGATVPQLDQEGRPGAPMLDEAGQPVLSRPDPALLERLARAGGGRYLAAGALGQAAAALAEALADLRRDPMAMAGRPRPVERFGWPLAAAFLLLLAAEWPSRFKQGEGAA